MNLALILIAVVLILVILSGIYREARRHGPHAILWRWFSGHTWHGNHLTNATWFRRATRVHTIGGVAMRWHHMPRLIRAGIRTGSTLFAIVLIYGLIKYREQTIISIIVTGGGAIIIGGIASIRSLRTLYTNRVTVTPMGMAIAPMLDVPESDATRSIIMKNGYATITEGELGRIILPPRFAANPAQKDSVEHLISSRLPIEVDFRWRTTSNPGVLSILASPQPPRMVKFADYVDYMESMPPGEVMLGLDRRSQPYTGSFNGGDDPHWGCSVGTGRGKSTFLQATAAQILHQDRESGITAIDPKMSSLSPLAGIPGVVLACDPSDIAEMWRALWQFEAIMMDRLRKLKKDPTITFPINLLIIDELNQFSAMSRTHWQGIQVGEPYGVGDLIKPPKVAVPPVWGWLASVLWQGRVVHSHVIVVGQRLDDRSTGGIGLRDSLGLRGIAGYRKNQFDMLIGTTPYIKPRREKGRWLWSDGDTESWVQNLYGDPAMIRDYAIANRLPAGAKNVIPGEPIIRGA
jgi:hypothetical protein